MKYRVNDAKAGTIEVSFNSGKVFLNGEETRPDLVFISPGKYHVLQDNISYNLEVMESNIAEKRFKIRVNGKVYDLTLEDALDIQLKKMGMSAADGEKVDKVKAPMPGLVLQILVTPGQEVKKGDSLIILEAMKMENVIKSQGAGVVKNILIRQKDAVEKNQVLIEME